MRKLMFVFVVFAYFPPIKINAEQEVKYKFYKTNEVNIHYELDPELSCKNDRVDKNSFITTSIKTSTLLPELKEGREITKVITNNTYSRTEFNYIIMRYFKLDGYLKIYEFDILDKNGDKVDYHINNYYFQDGIGSSLHDDNTESYAVLEPFSSLEINMPNPTNINELTFRIIHEDRTFYGINFGIYYEENLNLNSYSDYSEILSTTCENNICTTLLTVDISKQDNRLLEFKSTVYNYTDRMYKCYQIEKDYLPGYYKEMPGYYKDEEDYITEETDLVKQSDLDNVINNYNNLETILHNLSESNTYIKDNLSSTLESSTNKLLDKYNNLYTLLNKTNTSTTTKLDSSNEIESTVTKSTSPIAMVTKKTNTTEPNTDKALFLVIFGIFSLLLSILLFIKNVIKSRSK